MTEIEETMLRLTPEQKEKIEKLSIKYGAMMNELFEELSEMSPKGTFRWTTMYGFATFYMGRL